MKMISKEEADAIFHRAMKDAQEIKEIDQQIREELKSMNQQIRNLEYGMIATKVLKEL